MTKLRRGLLLYPIFISILGSFILPIQAQTVPVNGICKTSTGNWEANPVGLQTETFTISFDATPQASSIDANVALSQGAPGSYADLAAIVRFNLDGKIDVRSGSDYKADYSQQYSANLSYHFRVVANVRSRTYSVYVTPPNGAEQSLAANYPFRSEQANAANLSYWTSFKDPGSPAGLQVCNVVLGEKPASGCSVGSSTWTANSIGSQTGTFTVSFDASPQGNGIDANVALSQNAPGSYSDLAAIVRFNPAGNIDVMSGTSYKADYSQAYAANSSYHFRMVVNVATRTYSVYVTPPNGSERPLASDYPFRAQQANVTSLSYWSVYKDSASTAAVQVCNFSMGEAPASNCSVGADKWSGVPLPTSQRGTFSATFDTKPLASNIDANVSFSNAIPTNYTDLAAIVRFNPWGYIDVMNSSGYTSDYQQAYTANSLYRFTVNVDVLSRTYTVYVTPPGGTAQVLAKDYAFRAPQSNVTSLNYWTSYKDPGSAGSVQVCNLNASAAPGPQPVGVLSASPTSIAFNSVPSGTTASRPITITNTLTSSVTVYSASTSSSEFKVGGFTFPFTLAAGQSRAGSVSYTPSGSGPSVGTASFVSNAPVSPTTVSLTGSGVTVEARSVTLTWFPSSSKILGHNVYRSKTSGGSYTKLNAAPVPTSFVDTAVRSGESWYYVVTTVGESGMESTYSQEVLAVIPTS